MANAKGSTNFRNLMPNGKNSLLPPKSPFPVINPPYTDYIPSASVGPKSFSKSRDGHGMSYHQRTSSESLIEEQPSWLDELLDEPDTPVRRGHRRSSSDSFAYLDAASMSNIEYVPVSRDESNFRPMVSSPLWGTQSFDHGKETLKGSLYADSNFYGKQKNRAWDSQSAAVNHPSALHLSRDNGVLERQSSSELDSIPSTGTDRRDLYEYGSQDPKMSSEKKDGSYAKTSSDNDTKRAKQQFAQRSRVRKLQYIAELERNVQALQVEGSEVSAELEFLNQQNLILNMENKALKQRLESLNQEKLIKYLEHEVLEREKGRLRALHQLQQRQQQQQQQEVPHQSQSQSRQRPSSSHRRSNSRDLDSQFANLSLKYKDTNASTDSVSGPLRI